MTHPARSSCESGDSGRAQCPDVRPCWRQRTGVRRWNDEPGVRYRDLRANGCNRFALRTTRRTPLLRACPPILADNTSTKKARDAESTSLALSRTTSNQSETNQNRREGRRFATRDGSDSTLPRPCSFSTIAWAASADFVHPAALVLKCLAAANGCLRTGTAELSLGCTLSCFLKSASMLLPSRKEKRDGWRLPAQLYSIRIPQRADFPIAHPVF